MKSMPSFFALGSQVQGPVTWNPYDKSADIVLSGSNLVATQTVSVQAFRGVRATQSKNYTDNGYFEIAITSMDPVGPYIVIGIGTSSANLSDHVGSDAYGWGYYAADGSKVNGDALTSYGSSFAEGDVIGVAFKNGKVWFAKNNTWNGNPAADTGAAFTGITGYLFPFVTVYEGTSYPDVDSVTGRFKTSDFSYSPPSGFSAWE